LNKSHIYAFIVSIATLFLPGAFSVAYSTPLDFNSYDCPQSAAEALQLAQAKNDAVELIGADGTEPVLYERVDNEKSLYTVARSILSPDKPVYRPVGSVASVGGNGEYLTGIQPVVTENPT